MSITESIEKIFHSSRIEDLPEDFSEIPAVLFFKEYIKKARSKRKKARSNPKITIHGVSDVESSQAFIDKLDEAYPDLTGKQFNEIWETLRFSLDYGVMGGDPWQPKILPNGGVLIRNHHRVVSISERPIFSTRIEIDKFHRELTELQELMSSKFDVEQKQEYFLFSVLHRTENGITWTKSIPESLSPIGNTLVFIPASWINTVRNEGLESKFPTIAQHGFKKTVDQSSSGLCVIRTFSQQIFGYWTFRASDEFDVILEEFSTTVDWGVTDPDLITNPDINQQDNSSEVRCRVRDMSQQINTKGLSTLLSLLVNNAFADDYVKEKCHEIQNFPPIFGEKYDVPPYYWVNNKEYLYNYSKSKDGKIFVFKVHNFPVKSFKQFEKKMIEQIKLIIPSGQEGSFAVYFPSVDEEPFDGENFGIKLHSDELKLTLRNICKREKKIFKSNWANPASTPEELAQREEDHMDDVSPWYIIFETDSIPDPTQVHKQALLASSILDDSLTAIIPALGFHQGYCCGLEDSGNGGIFIPENFSDEDEEESDDE